MCITFFQIVQNGSCKYKLILSMNRDESCSRPTAPACWEGNLVGGWDRQPGREGGTWLAMDRKGRIGFLTNIYTGGEIDKNAAGRGHIITDFLKSEYTAKDYISELSQSKTLYNPFNLVLLEQDDKGYYSAWRYTRGKEGHTENFGPQEEISGTFGVSNHPQHQPYLKSMWGQKELGDIDADVCSEELLEKLEKIMTNSTVRWPDPQIICQSRTDANNTGPFAKYGENLSSVFVTVPKENYQTRTTSMILVDTENNVVFKEKNWEGEKTCSCMNFKIEM